MIQKKLQNCISYLYDCYKGAKASSLATGGGPPGSAAADGDKADEGAM